jgi:hypothetical protein
MKVYQKADCTRKGGRKQSSKWGRESAFRVNSVAKGLASLFVRLCTLYVRVKLDYHVVPPQYLPDAKPEIRQVQMLGSRRQGQGFNSTVREGKVNFARNVLIRVGRYVNLP